MGGLREDAPRHPSRASARARSTSPQDACTREAVEYTRTPTATPQVSGHRRGPSAEERILDVSLSVSAVGSEGPDQEGGRGKTKTAKHKGGPGGPASGGVRVEV